MRVVSAVSVSISIPFMLAETLFGSLSAGEIVMNSGWIIFGFIALFFLAGRPRATRFAEPLVLGFAVLLVFGLTRSGMVESTFLNPISYSPVIPMSAGAFLPWQPQWSLALGVISIAAPLLITPGSIDVSVPTFVAMGITYAVLAAVANQLQRRLWLKLESAGAQLIAAERLASLGQMIAGMGHELKTRLATASNRLAQIQSLASELDESVGHPEVSDDDLREIASELSDYASGAQHGVSRASRFVATLRKQTAGLNEVTSERFKIRKRVESALTLLDHIARKRQVEMVIEGDPDATLIGDPSRFEQVASNLIRNSLDACKTKGTKIVVSWERRGEDGLYFCVDDDGVGIPDEIVPRLFEPLFTTKADDGGTGIGLPLCRDIVEGTFGGTLRYVPSAVGARFEAHFPREGHMVRSAAPWTPLGRTAG